MTENMTQHNKFMRAAIGRARTAARHGETPVGAVIVRDGKIISGGRNKRENGKNALYHAEISAINAACKKLRGWRLFDCDIYVTLEPCPMCAGAIINARIRNVYYGAPDEKAGSFGSIVDLSKLDYNHKPNVTGGILKDECSKLLSDFFRNLRQTKKEKKQKSSEEE